MFRKKKKPFGRIIPPFSSKVQNLTVFSIIYMIRIRFFVPGELIQNGFSAAQYLFCLSGRLQLPNLSAKLHFRRQMSAYFLAFPQHALIQHLLATGAEAFPVAQRNSRLNGTPRRRSSTGSGRDRSISSTAPASFFKPSCVNGLHRKT